MSFKFLSLIALFFVLWALGGNVIYAAAATLVLALLVKVVIALAKYAVGPARGH